MREVEPPPDLAVGESLRRELRDLQLLRRELVARLGLPPAAPLARGAQLAPRLGAPRGASQRVEGVAGRPQGRPRFSDLTATPEPPAVGEEQAGARGGGPRHD